MIITSFETDPETLKKRIEFRFLIEMEKSE